MRVLDLFCGAAGGWTRGFHRAGMQTVAACEIDDWRRAVFAASHPDCRMYRDVRDLTAEHLQNDLGYLPDVIVGSPPCQEISAANSKGAGITDDHLFWEWARLVFEIRPLWCAAENSPRARTSGIDGILDALDQAGYAVWPCVVGADNAGANHKRKRLWLVAADAYRLDRAEGAAAWEAARQGRHDSCGRCSVDDGNAAGVERVRFGRFLGRRSTKPTQVDLRDAADVNRARHSFRPSFGSDDGAELPPALRDIGCAWPDWNGGITGLSEACAAAGFGSLDDGAAFGLPAGLRNRAIATLGDSVLPQITEIIGRAILSAERVAA